MSALNASWHSAHKMPRNATLQARVAWHRSHARHCACRPIPPGLRALIDVKPVKRSPVQAAAALRELLRGGDRRSVAQSARARLLVARDPARVGELARLTRDRDWLVAMRALDLLEKFAHTHVDWVRPYKRVFIGPLADAEQWEIRLQVVRALPLFDWRGKARRRAVDILTRDASHPQLFVRAWALDGLAALAVDDASLRASLLRLLCTAEASGRRSLMVRARRIRERLARRSGVERKSASARATG